MDKLIAAAKLPSFSGPIAFPSIDQINAAKKVLDSLRKILNGGPIG